MFINNFVKNFFTVTIKSVDYDIVVYYNVQDNTIIQGQNTGRNNTCDFKCSIG